jgi:hypothetical protein
MSWLMSALTVDRDDGFVATADSDDGGYDAGGYDDGLRRRIGLRVKRSSTSKFWRRAAIG